MRRSRTWMFPKTQIGHSKIHMMNQVTRHKIHEVISIQNKQNVCMCQHKDMKKLQNDCNHSEFTTAFSLGAYGKLT